MTGAASWAAASNVFMRVANIAMSAVLARLLSPSDFGVFALALAIYVVLSSLAELGLGSAIVRTVGELGEIAPTVTTIAWMVSGGLAATMTLLAAPLAAAVGAPDAADPIRILAISVLLTGVFAVPGSQLARDFRQDRLFAATIAGFLPANIVLVLLALNGNGASAFAWSRVVGQLITGAVMVASLETRYRPGLDRARVVGLLAFGLPLALANLVNWALLNADYVILGRTLSAASVGVYMIAFTVANWSTAVLGSALNSVVVPGLARVGADRGEQARALDTGLRIVALVAAPIAVTTCVLADPLVPAVFGERWAAAAPVLSVLSLYGLLYAFTLLLVNVLVARARTARLLAIQVVWVCTLVPAMLWSVRFGLVGVAWAHVVVVLLLVLPLYAVALGEARPTIGHVAQVVRRPVAAALVAGGAAWSVAHGIEWSGHWPALLCGGTTAVATYLALTGRMWMAVLPVRARGPRD